MKKILSLSLLFSFCFSFLNAQTVLWSEDFGSDPVGGCTSSGTLANGHATTNGTWTQVSTGPNATEGSVWYVSTMEEGKTGGQCSNGCGYTAGNATDRTLHVSSHPNWAGDQGAAYEIGGACGIVVCVEANLRMESPVINMTGQSNLTLNFDYLHFGDLGLDYAELWYFDGTTWSNMLGAGTQLPQTSQGPCSPQFQWDSYSIPLPASANNNNNIKIGFNWTNNDDGSGADPSFAVDNIQITTPTSAPLPTAAFTPSNDTICSGACITFADNSTSSNTITSWNWTFPGGTPATATGQNPGSVCFNTPGTYNVKLLVTDANGSDSTTVTVQVDNCALPTAAFTPSNDSICSGSCITFADNSTSSNTITSWNWTFPGGTPATATGQNPGSVCFNTPGNYNVKLLVTDANGSDSTTTTIKVVTCTSVTAQFSADNTTVCAGDTVTFTDNSVGGATVWVWDFDLNGAGTATPGTAATVGPHQVVYSTPGVYDVQLIVSDGTNLDTLTQIGYITVIDCSPIASFSASQTNVCVGDCINFNDLSTGTPTAWSWTFTGGTPGTSIQQNPTNICYNTAGTYPVSLTVTNQYGNDDTTMVSYITVDPCTAPVAGAQLSDTVLCEDGCIEVSYSGTGGMPTSFNWVFEGGVPSTSTLQNPGTVCWPDTTGIFNIGLIVSNTNGSDTVNYTVNVYDKPLVSAGLDTTINLGSLANLSAQATDTAGNPLTGGNYIWTPSGEVTCFTCQHTTAGPTSPTNYVVTYTNQYGCTAKDTIFVDVDIDYSIGVPNAFSPNGDGNNDVLKVKGELVIQSLEFVIYNRYGQEVFSTSDKKQGWDGTHKGLRVNPGVFTYFVKATLINGDVEELKGNVTLVR